MRRGVKKLNVAECIGKILMAAIADSDISREQLAKLTGISRRTIDTDLKEPIKITLARLVLYFQVLDVPADECLMAFSQAYAQHLVMSRYDYGRIE